MAIKVTITTSFGEERECYVRLNNVEASNHGVSAHALFRAFLSQEAFASGAHYVAEFPIEFQPDVSQPLWPQAYQAIKMQDGFEGAVDC